jgi:hypothetical protein
LGTNKVIQYTVNIVVPSSALESMQLGGLSGITALTMELQKEKSPEKKEEEI